MCTRSPLSPPRPPCATRRRTIRRLRCRWRLSRRGKSWMRSKAVSKKPQLTARLNTTLQIATLKRRSSSIRKPRRRRRRRRIPPPTLRAASSRDVDAQPALAICTCMQPRRCTPRSRHSRRRRRHHRHRRHRRRRFNVRCSPASADGRRRRWSRACRTSDRYTTRRRR